MIERAYPLHDPKQMYPRYLVVQVWRNEFGRPVRAKHNEFKSLAEAWTFCGNNKRAENFVNKLPLMAVPA